MVFRASSLCLLALLAAVSPSACSDSPGVDTDGADDDVGPDGPDDDSSTAGGGNPSPGDDDVDVPVETPDDDADDDDVVVPTEPCDGVPCDAYTHCVDNAGVAECVPNVCGDLDCGADSVCETTAAGDYCRDLGCSVDVECADGELCGPDELCIAQSCEPSARHCDGNMLFACDARGGEEGLLFECGTSGSYFASTCVEGDADTTCTCEDDWDCPPFTICDQGLCSGTFVAPTCSLPPAPFSADDTALEISWGGVSDTQRLAVDSPYPDFAQAQITPLVANLTDDNGDGNIDEQDVPEIIFVSFHNDTGPGAAVLPDGVLRAIHGGPVVRTENGEQVVVTERGADFFAICDPDEGVRWTEDDGFVGGETCGRNQPRLDGSGPIAVGDLDYDGVPEIVALHEYEGGQTQLYIFSNRGEFIAKGPSFDAQSSSLAPAGQTDGGVTIANIDAAGNAEIIVGRWVFQLETGTPPPAPPLGDAGAPPGGGPGGAAPLAAEASENFSLYFGAYFSGVATNGANGSHGPVSCVANLIDDGDGAVQEVVAGAAVYSMPLPAAGEVDQDACSGTAWCDRALELRWQAAMAQNGFCAVADVLGVDPALAPGPDNPLDGKPEVVLQSDGALYIYAGETGDLLRSLTTVANPSGGGPPNVDDFDGDGFPEIGTAAGIGYTVFDLQEPSALCPAWPAFADRRNPERAPPGMSCETHADCGDTAQFACNERSQVCVCQHNSWVQTTQDASSRVTGSSVFDFNGDGAAEVIYNDECNFRVYDGLSGDILMQEWGEARTRIEYPVVADVDRDGNAEIVFSTTNESTFCTQYFPAGETPPDRSVFNNGIEVWGDQRDLWVPARAIWNQHAYHVTNITEGGAVPRSEPESWRKMAGVSYNTYRSNPRNYGVAPDLVVLGAQVTSPDAACGQLGTLLDIVLDIGNDGDLLVGGEVRVGIEGGWDGEFQPLLDEAGQPILLALGSALAPRRHLLLSYNGYAPANNAESNLPTQLRIVVDVTEIETECIEDNNDLTVDVVDGDDLPDLKLALSGSPLVCPNPKVTVTLTNDGSAAASDIPIAFFAGDPNQGGRLILTETFAGPLAAGESTTFDVTVPLARTATIFGVVDYEQAIAECNDGNNGATGPDLECVAVIY